MIKFSKNLPLKNSIFENFEREGLWMLKITKSCIQKLLIFVRFKKCAKKYYLIRDFLFLLLTVEIEDGRKVPCEDIVNIKGIESLPQTLIF